MQNELIRKAIHLLTATLPLIYFFYLDREQMSLLCISLFVLFLVCDLGRIYVTLLRQIYEKIFGKLLRDDEKGNKLNGATFLLLGFLVSVILFEKNIAIISMLILALSDSLAAIFGMQFGKNKWHGKTLQGSSAFFITTFLISSFFNDNTGINILGAALITFVELISGKLNDNVTIPVVSGLFFTLAKDYFTG
jgi:dolichol kinase